MCAIAGFLDRRCSLTLSEASATARSMADAMLHRGPDDGGVWADAGAGIALGHRRLSIIDLSPMGHQPMISSSGNTVIAYNGEVFNHVELRAELEQSGSRFRGGSDTEVILEACEKWGIEKTAARLIGMFAFALWDSKARTLSLVRDRIGIKPLYWGEFAGQVLFASELKALRQHPSFRPEIDRNSLCAFLRYNYVPAPRSIYAGVYKLAPGSILTFAEGAPPRPIAFWSMPEVVRKGRAGFNENLSDADAEEKLNALLLDAVGRRMIADVPLGAFLSGGIDSSTVVALMQAQSVRPIRTFSIGSHDAAYDEAKHAKAVAAHLGTDHLELYVQASDALDLIPRLPFIYDEPFADSSQIPTYLVSALTRKHVTVALSGDGGDELFGGYNRHVLAQSIWPLLSSVPRPFRRAAAAMIQSVSPERWDAAQEMLPRRLRRPNGGEKLHKLAKVMACDEDGLYQHLVSHWEDPRALVIGATESAPIQVNPAVLSAMGDPAHRMQYLDAITYLPDDILTKVDRASMAVSLEARVPLLDHRVVEFAWTLPVRFRIRGDRSKWLLRKVLGRYVPDALVERPKMGFGVPIDAWLRGPLREWAETLLDETRIRSEGYLNPEPIRRKWAEHLSGARNWQEPLWGVLMFQAWLEVQR